MSNALSSSFSSNKTSQIKSLKIAMSSTLSSTYFTPKNISTIILKDKGSDSTEPQTDSSPITTQDENSNLLNIANNQTIINIFVSYIDYLNKLWEQKYEKMVYSSKQEQVSLKKKIDFLIKENKILKQSILSLVNNIRQFQNDCAKEEEKKNQIICQIIKENEYLRKVNEVCVLKKNLDSTKLDNYNPFDNNFQRGKSQNTIKKQSFGCEEDENEIGDNLLECLSNRSRSTVINIDNDDIHESENYIENCITTIKFTK